MNLTDAAVKTKHKLSHCELCDTDMVICATCGNNCCNGGYGTVDGVECTDCPEAYHFQEMFWKDPNSVKFESRSPDIPLPAFLKNARLA
jgi:hypothetical protein